MPRWSSGAAVPLVLLSVLFVPSAAAADVTSTVVTGPTTQVVHGQSATFAATVTNTTAPASIPTGAVQLYLNGAPAGPPIALSATGTAPLQTPPLQRGDYAVRAAYLGGPGFEPSAGTTTMSVTRAATTTKVVLTPSTGAVAGEGIGFEVQVEPTTPALGTPTGTVTLLAFGTPLLQGPLGLDGFVRGELELPAVSATAVIAYSGDNAYAESETSVAVTVNKAGTVVVLSASPTTATVGQPVTFTALVDSLAPSMWWPSGQLTGAAIPGALTVDGSGTPRTFSQAFSTPGVHRVTVHFTGDEDFLASDAGLDVTVTGPPAAAPRPTAVTPRGLSVKATPKRDRRAPYRFAISGQVQLPSGAAPADAAQGKVTVDATVKGKRVARKIATVDRAGRYKTTITLRRKGSAKITAKFAGNARVTAVTARAVTVRAG